MSLTNREIQGIFGLRIAINWQQRARELGIFAAIAAFLTFIAPYDATRGMGPVAAFAYWFFLIIIGAAAGEVTSALLERVWPNIPDVVSLLILSLVTALAVSICLIALAHVQNGPIPLSYWPRVYGLVFVIAAAVTSIGFLTDRAFNPAPAADEGAAPTAAFLERLPVKYRTAELYAVSSEDHYLRVHTSLGEEMILMRLADAMRELSGADGLQTHRSWWVADAGVADAERANGKLTLTLKSGASAPVSRTFSKAVKARGLG